jgi:Na+-driven multidrug efflux pump
MSSAIIAAVTLFVIILRIPLMKLFTDNIEVVKIGAEYLVIVSTFYLVFNAMFTIGGVMRGAGDTLIPMFVTLFSLWVIRIPLAFFLSKRFGEVGIWWSIPIGWAMGMMLSYLYYLTGRWKNKSVMKHKH